MAKMRKQWKKLAKIYFPDYTGRKFFEVSQPTITFSNTNWSEGSRTQYKAMVISTATVGSFNPPAPWNNPYEGRTVDLPFGVLIFTKTIFTGLECGITVYFNPATESLMKKQTLALIGRA